MSIGPVSGNGISLSLPPGKTVFWNVSAQATYQQYVKLVDSTGITVFEASGGSTDGHSPTQIGQGTFQVNENVPYVINIGTNMGSSWSTVVWDDMALTLTNTIMCMNINFISEDSGDSDFNDSAVSLTWFNSIG